MDVPAGKVALVTGAARGQGRSTRSGWQTLPIDAGAPTDDVRGEA